MPNPCFDIAAKVLEDECGWDALTARGTLRITLKSAGLDAGSVDSHQLGVAVDKVLEAELSSRGIDGPRRVCDQILETLTGVEDGPKDDSPEDIFARLARHDR